MSLPGKKASGVRIHEWIVVLSCIAIILFIVFTYDKPWVGEYRSEAPRIEETVTSAVQATIEEKEDSPDDVIEIQQESFAPPLVVTHIDMPEAVRAIYMTNWVASRKDLREGLVDFIEGSEINAVVIDIVDYSGKVGFDIPSLLAHEYGSIEQRVKDMPAFIAELHEKGIYVIGRLTVFQDPHMVSVRPDLAVASRATGAPWEDHKGISWIDPNAREMWDYVIDIARASHEIGFDEINFDYIRFPSDGPMADAVYPFSEGLDKPDVIEEFFAYLSANLREGDNPIITSADLFGMVTTNRDDLNIGQVLERALPHFDVIAPMVYPSHYPNGFHGYANPNDYPYDLIYYVMSTAYARTEVLEMDPDAKLRPWLQDFDYGGVYGVSEVQDQIKGTYDAGLDSWMIWDPANRYTRAAYEPAGGVIE